MTTSEVLGDLLAVAGDRLAGYGYLLTGNAHAGEELAQAAIVKVFVRRRRLSDVRAAEAYVRAAMRTLHVDGIRRERRWRLAMPGQARAEHGPDAASALAEADALGRALAALFPQERTVVILRYYDDLTLQSVADHMRLALGTVKRYHANALDKLRAHLGDVEIADAWVSVVDGSTGR